MAITVNLRHLELHDIELAGELPVEELDLGLSDELVRAEEPLRYRLNVQKLESSLLVQGDLHLTLACQCVRCLRPVAVHLDLNQQTWHLALQGEEKVPVSNDCVDLTPYVREDILLEFPQHPLCESNCRGLPKSDIGKAKKPSDTGLTQQPSSTWAKLDKLKF